MKKGTGMTSDKTLSSKPSLMARLPDFIQLTRLDRPIGIYLLMWPTLWALWIAADGTPSFKLCFIFITGVILTRTAGCIVNDFADRKFDGHVSRTSQRPLATGKISSKEALTLAAGIGILCFVLVWFTNTRTILFSFGGLLLACTYPYMKRHTYYPQLVLGAAFAWAVPMAFTAVQKSVPSYAWLIYLATVSWTMAYDTLYAMVDREDDLKIGIKSTAILFGDADLAMIGLLEAIAFISMWFLGNHLSFSHWYFAGLIVAAALWGWQLWHCRQRDRDRCFKAFLHNHWVGAVIFTGLFLHYFLPS